MKFFYCLSLCLVLSLGCKAVLAAPGSLFPPRYEVDDHRVIAMAAENQDTPAIALTNKGVWDSQIQLWNQFPGQREYDGVPTQDVATYYNSAVKETTMWSLFRDVNGTVQIAASCLGSVAAYGPSAAFKFPDGYTRPYVSSVQAFRGCSVLLCAITTCRYGFSSGIILIPAYSGSSVILAKSSSWNSAPGDMAWPLDADTIGLSHFSSVNATHFLFLEWTASRNYPIALIGTTAGPTGNVSLTEITRNSYFDILVFKQTIVAFYVGDQDTTITQLFPERILLQVSNAASPNGYTIQPIAPVSSTTRSKSKNTIKFLEGLVFFNTEDYDAGGSRMGFSVRFIRLSEDPIGSYLLCTACSMVHMELIAESSKFVMSGPSTVAPFRDPFYSQWRRNGDIWRTLIFTINEATNNPTILQTIETGMVVSTWLPRTGNDNFVLNAFEGPAGSTVWPVLSSIRYNSTHLNQSAVALRTTCFYDFNIAEMMLIRPVMTRNSSSATSAIWFPAITDQGRAIFGVLEDLERTIVSLSRQPTKFPLFDTMILVRPQSFDLVTRLSTNNEASTMGILSTQSGQSQSVLDVRTNCMQPMVLIPGGATYGRDLTLVQFVTSDDARPRLAVIRHSDSGVSQLALPPGAQAFIGAKEEPNLDPWNSLGTFAASGNGTHAQVVLVDRDANVVRSVVTVPNLSGSELSFYAHTFGGSSKAIMIVYEQVFAYDSANGNVIDHSAISQLSVLPQTKPVAWGNQFVFITQSHIVYNSSDGVTFSSFFSDVIPTTGVATPEICHTSKNYLICGWAFSSGFSQPVREYAVVNETGYAGTVSIPPGSSILTLFDEFVVYVKSRIAVIVDGVRVARLTFGVRKILEGFERTSFEMLLPDTYPRTIKPLSVNGRLFIGCDDQNIDIVMLSAASIREITPTKRAAGDGVLFLRQANNSTFSAVDDIVGPYGIVGSDVQVVWANALRGLPSGAPVNLTQLLPLPCLGNGDCNAQLCNASFCEAPVSAVPTLTPTLSPSLTPSANPTASAPINSQIPIAVSPSTPSPLAFAAPAQACASLPAGWTCVNGAAVYPGNLTLASTESLTLAGPAVVQGDLVMSDGSSLGVNVGSPLTVQGCVALDGTLNVGVPPNTQIANGQQETLINHNGNCGGRNSSFDRVNTNFQEQSCKSANAAPVYQQRSMAVVFSSVDETGCGVTAGSGFPWWAGLIIGLIILILLVIIVIIIVKRDKIIPYYRSRNSMRAAKASIEMRQKSETK